MPRDDPRDASLETPLTLPKTWVTQYSDGVSAISMFLSGAVMVTRNRWLGWPAVLIAFNSFINQHPMRTKEGGNAWSSIGLATTALIAGYLPTLMIPQPDATPVQLPVN